MAGKRQQLSERAIKAVLKIPGRYPDGESLYFQVTDRLNTSWEYNYRIHGRARSMGLGAFPKVSLRQARELRDDARKLVRAGTDPIIARGAKRQIAASVLSVAQACESYITAQRPKWKTKRHVEQIRQRLADYVFPVIGSMPIAEVQGAEARQVLSPIWQNRNPTAKRLRQILEDVINWSVHEGIRRDESNPFEKKKLQYALPFGIHKAIHHPALSYLEAPRFFVELRAQSGVKAKAMQFVLLCGVRIGDICGGDRENSTPMLWSHADLAAGTWVIPITKMGREHVVPLSAPALRLLDEMKPFTDPSNPDIVFPGANAGTVLNAATLRHMLRSMNYGGRMTTHGARSMLRTWASECTNFEKDVIEASLAHAKTGLDAAYHRATYTGKRHELMRLWGSYLEGGEAVPQGATVLALRA